VITMAENDTDLIQTTETEVGGVKKTIRKFKRKCTVVRVAQAKGWRNVVVLDTKEGKNTSSARSLMHLQSSLPVRNYLLVLKTCLMNCPVSNIK